MTLTQQGGSYGHCQYQHCLKIPASQSMLLENKASTPQGCCYQQCPSHVVIRMEGQWHGQPVMGSPVGLKQGWHTSPLSPGSASSGCLWFGAICQGDPAATLALPLAFIGLLQEEAMSFLDWGRSCQRQIFWQSAQKIQHKTTAQADDFFHLLHALTSQHAFCHAGHQQHKMAAQTCRAQGTVAI